MYDLNENKLEIRFPAEFNGKEDKSMSSITKYMKGLAPVKRTFYSEKVIHLKILMTVPESNTISERSAICLKKLEN